MSFKLTVSSKDVNIPTYIFTPENDNVTIGRDEEKSGNQNYLCLHDKLKVISREHAQIEFHNGFYKILDLSENGTSIEGQPLKRGEWHTLHNNDKIRVGEYFLSFYSDRHKESRGKRSKNLLIEAKRIAGVLEQTCAANAKNDNSSRSAILLSKLKEELKQLKNIEALEVFILLKKLSNARQAGAAGMILSDTKLQTELFRRVQNENLHEASLASLIKLKYRFFENGFAFNSKQDIDSFCTQVENVLEILLQGIMELLAGRRAFEENLDAGVSMMLQRDQNPVKTKRTMKSLAGYLLDWSDPENSRKLTAELQNALEDLKLHGIATTAAFREAVTRGYDELMSKIDPDVIDRQIKKKKPFLFWPFLQAASWERFKRKYKKQKDMSRNQWVTQMEDKFVEVYQEFHKQHKIDSETVDLINEPDS